MLMLDSFDLQNSRLGHSSQEIYQPEREEQPERFPRNPRNTAPPSSEPESLLLFGELDLGGYSLLIAPRVKRKLKEGESTPENLEKVYKREYKEVCKETPCLTHKLKFEEKQKQFPTSCHHDNWSKNRYPDVLCDESSRFKFFSCGISSSCESIVFSDELFSSDSSLGAESKRETAQYINANYIRGEHMSNSTFIATQAPLESTMGDFYEMLWQASSNIVISLSSVIENNKVKMVPFWPERVGEKLEFAPYFVTLVDEHADESGEGIRVRVLSVHNSSTGTSRKLYQIHYTEWPDSGVPKTPISLFQIYSLQLKFQREGLREGLTGPVVCHCSAGIGRTATYMAFVFGVEIIQELKKQQGAVSRGVLNANVNVPSMVAAIRKQRSGSVQTWQQYAFIYNALNYYLKFHCI